jgi:hypothetical protein
MVKKFFYYDRDMVVKRSLEVNDYRICTASFPMMKFRFQAPRLIRFEKFFHHDYHYSITSRNMQKLKKFFFWYISYTIISRLGKKFSKFF